jgi:hypothetical protein
VRHPQLFPGLIGGDFPGAPLFQQAFVVLPALLARPAELLSPGLRRRDTFSLPLADKSPLGLSRVGLYLNF